MSSISEWTGLVVRDRQQGRQKVTVQMATGTALPTSLTGRPAAPSLILAPARDRSAARAWIAPRFPIPSSAAARAGVVSPFLTGHLQP